MDVQDRPKSYPVIPAKNWWDLRRKFAQSLPKQVTPSYLQTALSLGSEQSAKNLMAPLKALGLIDDDGRPTDLAQDWRGDDSYPDACRQMLEAVYPHELCDLFPDPLPDRGALTNWFMRSTKTGQSACSRMATLFYLLRNGDPNRQDTVEQKRAERAPAARGGNGRTVVGKTPVAASDAATHVAAAERRGFVPSVHVAVQVYISPESTPEQIDQVFASMAKHLQGVNGG